jgi:hypothetical protein
VAAGSMPLDGSDASNGADAAVESGPADASSGSVDAGSNLDVGSSSDIQTSIDAPACSIALASDYDQTCVVDSDCVAVGQVGECPANPCNQCTTGAINKGVLPQYQAAFALAFVGALGQCNCACGGPALCHGGKCLAGACGPPLADTLPACADAGGRCNYSANTTCNAMGPPDACAYSDEVCCIQ